MNVFTLNVVFAVVWQGLMADFSLRGLVVGYVIGFGTLWVTQPLYGDNSPYFRRVWRILRLIGYFLYELVLSSIHVVWDVLTPTHRSDPAIIEVPLDVRSDTEILLVTNLISLTPGTLSLDVSPDRRTLTIHAMFAGDPQAQCDAIKNGMERMVREVFE